jgi:hypothetical protein
MASRGDNAFEKVRFEKVVGVVLQLSVAAQNQEGGNPVRPGECQSGNNLWPLVFSFREKPVESKTARGSFFQARLGRPA